MLVVEEKDGSLLGIIIIIIRKGVRKDEEDSYEEEA